MKISQKKSIITIALFLCLGFASCLKDHDLEIVPAVLVTLPFEVKNQSYIFSIQVDELGNRKIVEYGIVYTAYYRGVGDHNLFPTLQDSKLIFDSPPMPGLNQLLYQKDFINGRAFIYYRSYAKMEDGTVLYGNRLTFTN